MNLFPHFIARLGGAPFDLLKPLEVVAVQPLLQEHALLQEQLAKTAAEFSDTVYGVISAQEDKKIQNKLLNLKRTIFNQKKVSENEQTTAETYLTGKALELFNSYQKRSQLLDDLDSQAEKIFTEDFLKIRNKLASLAAMPSLQKGLLLSSQALLNNVDDYRKQDLSRVRKKELKTEESLIKYLSRMTAKTSPFSTFTNLSMGSFTNGTNEDVTLDLSGDHHMVSHISLNNNIYLYLRGLMLRLAEIYRNFEIRLNPTLSLQGEVYVFLTNNNNVEAFQRLPHNGVIELFYELILEKKGGVVFGELVKEIIDNEYVDASSEELEDYITQLINFGFIEFNIGVSGIDPYWDLKLTEILAKLVEHSPMIQPIIEAIKTTRDYARQYANAETPERKRLLYDGHKALRDMCMVLHEAAGLPADERKPREELEMEGARKAAENKKKEGTEEKKEEKAETLEDEAFTHQHNTFFHFKPEQIFYEDTTSNIVPEADEKLMQQVLGDLKTLVYSLTDFDGFLDEQEKMVDFFTKKYPEQTNIPVMQFYEDFFREIKVPEAKQQREIKEKKEGVGPLPEVEVTGKRRALNQSKLTEITNMVKQHLADPQRVDITAAQLAEILPPKTNVEGSFGAFVQPFYEDGKLRLVANSYFPGFGKMFSRFLHIFPEQLTTDLRGQNAPNPEIIYIEDVDASVFNANLHPPLMPFEIWMPGGQNTLPSEKQIPVTDLEVKLDKEMQQLQLVLQATQQKCYVFDLGFQGQRGRSQLFQLLSRFSPCKALQWMAINSSVNGAVNPDGGTEQLEKPIVLPRIVFNDSIVLQRKRWVIRKEFIPLGDSTETEWQVFKRVNKWRKSLELPDHVFVFLTNFGEMESLEPEQAKKMGRDGYKPQYINFNSPLLVNLLDKMFDKLPIALRVEEMLPHPSGMLKTQDGQSWVSEFVVQWYDQAATKSPKVDSAFQTNAQ